MNTALQQRIELEQVGMVYRYAANVFIGLVVLGAVFAYVITIDRSLLVAAVWYAGLLSTCLVRWLYHRRFLSRERDVSEAKRWRLIVIGGATATGIMWAIPGTLLLPVRMDAQLFVCACMMGIVAPSVAALAPLRSAFTWFVVPFIGSVAVAQLIQGGIHIYFGVGLLVFLGAMLGVAYRTHADVTRMLMLAFQNDELVARLAAENHRVAQMNADLQSQVTERQRAEQLLLAAKSEAEAASRAKSQFLANMSHEVRTPLHAVMGMTELLKRTSLDDKQAKLANTAHSASERLLGIIDDILDLSRVEAGRVRLQHVQFAPRIWVAEVAALLRPQAAAKRLQLTYEVAARVPEQLRGDSERLRQVLVNLITNAIKFTDVGSIHVLLQLTQEGGAEEPSLHCTVTDTGVGIAPDMHQRLFQPFSQLDESTTRRVGGTGLGLAICRQLVNAMGGRIELKSVVGQGSTFWFAVPIDTLEPIAEHAAIAPSNVPALRGHLLIAEDNEVNCELLVDMLQFMGCTCEVVQTGRAAVERAIAGSFDAVIMDWHMPEMDGLQATRLIREQDVRARNATPIPIIALTASVMSSDRKTCLDAGMNDYLGKPFSYEALAQVLRRWLPVESM